MLQMKGTFVRRNWLPHLVSAQPPAPPAASRDPYRVEKALKIREDIGLDIVYELQLWYKYDNQTKDNVVYRRLGKVRLRLVWHTFKENIILLGIGLWGLPRALGIVSQGQGNLLLDETVSSRIITVSGWIQSITDRVRLPSIVQGTATRESFFQTGSYPTEGHGPSITLAAVYFLSYICSRLSPPPSPAPPIFSELVTRWQPRGEMRTRPQQRPEKRTPRKRKKKEKMERYKVTEEKWRNTHL